jgi:hypothetical protein
MEGAVEHFTDNEVAPLVAFILEKLEDINASDVILGIDESRRVGIEEPLGREPSLSKADQKQLGTVRTRPLRQLEMMRLVLERLHQRLIVVPAIGRALRKRLNASDIVWRVDTEFVASDRSRMLVAGASDLLPEDLADVVAAFARVREMIPDLVPPLVRNG